MDGSNNFRSLTRESLTEKLILSKNLKEERKQAIQIPRGGAYVKGPDVGESLLGSVNEAEEENRGRDGMMIQGR